MQVLVMAWQGSEDMGNVQGQWRKGAEGTQPNPTTCHYGQRGANEVVFMGRLDVGQKHGTKCDWLDGVTTGRHTIYGVLVFIVNLLVFSVCVVNITLIIWKLSDGRPTIRIALSLVVRRRRCFVSSS